MDEKLIEQQFSHWCIAQSQLDGKKITPRDFDCWISGYIAGWSIGKKYDMQKVKTIIDKVVNSEIAKIVGVSGTEKETFVEEKLNAKKTTKTKK